MQDCVSQIVTFVTRGTRVSGWEKTSFGSTRYLAVFQTIFAARLVFARLPFSVPMFLYT